MTFQISLCRDLLKSGFLFLTGSTGSFGFCLLSPLPDEGAKTQSRLPVGGKEKLLPVYVHWSVGVQAYYLRFFEIAISSDKHQVCGLRTAWWRLRHRKGKDFMTLLLIPHPSRTFRKKRYNILSLRGASATKQS